MAKSYGGEKEYGEKVTVKTKYDDGWDGYPYPKHRTGHVVAWSGLCFWHHPVYFFLNGYGGEPQNARRHIYLYT